MKTAQLLFLISRTHGLMAHLLKTQDYVRLLGTRDLQDLVDFLLSTDYSTELSLIPTSEVSAAQLEQIIYEKLAKRWYSLVSASSGKTRKLLEAHNARFEIENLKMVIRAVHGRDRIPAELFISVPRKYQRVNFRALSEAKSMIEVAELLREPPYNDFEQWLGEYEKYDNPIVLEAQLDKTYCGDFWAKTHKNPDCDKLRDLIGTELDIRNLQVILSAKFMKLEPQLIRKMTFDLGNRLQRNAVAKLVNVELQGMPGMVLWPSYSELVREAVNLAVEGRLVDMEILFSRYMYSYYEKMAMRNPNNLVYVFSYLSLCLREARDLKTLSMGKQLKINRENLRNLTLY